MDVVVLGPGAIGSILAAHLAKSGHSVHVIARGERANFIRNNGLVIEGLSNFSVPVDVVTDAAQLRKTDLLIVATKTPGTEEALNALRHVSVGAAFSIQNGLMKNKLLVDAFGADNVLGALANTSGELQSSGAVVFTRNVNLLLGELSGEISERSQAIANAIALAGVKTSAVNNILSYEWSKFCVWVGLMGLSITTRADTWRFLCDPNAAKVLVTVVREAVTLAKARGVSLTNEGAVLPLLEIISLSESQAIKAVQGAGNVFRENSPNHKMSCLQDILNGRAMELEETLGYAKQLAEEESIAMPNLEMFYQLAKSIENTRNS